MNAKLNNHIGQQNEYKAYLNERLDKLDALTLNREIEKIPTKYEMLQMDQTLKRIIADVESIRNDQLTQKELDLIKQEEADAFFKKTANDYFNKLREMDDQLKRVTEEKTI
jgi:glutamyl-tRNA reductase